MSVVEKFDVLAAASLECHHAVVRVGWRVLHRVHQDIAITGVPVLVVGVRRARERVAVLPVDAVLINRRIPGSTDDVVHRSRRVAVHVDTLPRLEQVDGDPHRRDRRVVRSIGRLERHVAGVAVPLEVVGHRLEFGPNLSHRPVRRADRAGKCSVEVLLVILQRCRGCLDGSEINWRAAVAFKWFGHVPGPLVEVV